MLPIDFHLTSPEFVGSISMATIQKGDNVKSTQAHVHSPPYQGWQGPVPPSVSDQLSENAKEQNLKCTPKPELKSKEQHCLPLKTLADPKVNEHIHSQPGSNMVNILCGHQERRQLASIQMAGMLQPIHVLGRLVL